MTFKLGIVGSRTITDKDVFVCTLEDVPWLPNRVRTLSPTDMDLEIVTGGADGVDTLAEEWALDQGFDVTIHKPNWEDWSSGHPSKERNTEIVEDADAVLALWDGQSPGTRDSIDKTVNSGKPLYVEVVE